MGLGKPLKSITHSRTGHVPVFMGAEGPKNIALATEIADGWFPQFAPDDEGRATLERMHDYARAAGRDPAPGGRDACPGRCRLPLPASDFEAAAPARSMSSPTSEPSVKRSANIQAVAMPPTSATGRDNSTSNANIQLPKAAPRSRQISGR